MGKTRPSKVYDKEPMELPLAAKELNHSGRRLSTYLLRMAAPAAAISILALYLQVSLQPDLPLHIDDVGQTFVQLVLIVLALAVFLGLPFIGAVQIAQEKQDRTLGLLLLADLSGRDIFLAKLLSVTVYGLCLVASGIPILMLSVYFGVTTVQSVLFQGALLIAMVLTMSSLSMLWSTIAPDPRTALFATFGCLAAFVAVSSYIGYASGVPVNPLHLLFMTPDDLRGRGPFLVAYLLGLFFASVAFTIVALRAFPRQAYAETAIAERDDARPRRWRWLDRYIARPSPMAALLEFAMAPPGFGARRQTRRSSLVALSVLALLCGPLMLPLLAVLIVFDVASNMRTIMAQGTLDDVRLLPLDDMDLGASIHDAHRHRALPYLAPALCSGVTFLVGLAVATVQMQARITQQGDIFDWLLLALCGEAYVFACLWLIRSLVSITLDCSRKEHRVARITSTAVTTFAGFLMATGYIGMFPLVVIAIVAGISGAGAVKVALSVVLVAELVMVFVLRRTGRDYERTFIRLWERDIHTLAERVRDA